MKKYRTKSETVEAVLYDGENKNEISAWLGLAVFCKVPARAMPLQIEGNGKVLNVPVGWYVTRKATGKLDAQNKAEFEATHEEVGPTSVTVDLARALQLLKTVDGIKMTRRPKIFNSDPKSLSIATLWVGRYIAVGKDTDGGPLIYDYQEECDGIMWMPKPEDITAEDWVVVT